MKFKLWGTRGSIPSPLLAENIEAKIRAALSAAGEATVDLSDPNAISAFVASLPFAIRGTTGGDTSCLEVRSAGNLLIFDCGSGIRQLGFELMKQEFGRGQGVAHVIISHTHWDHMLGWPFFVPAFIPGNKIYIYGVHKDLEQRFRLQQTAPGMFPISLDYQSADIRFITLEEGETLQIGQTRVSNMRFHHPGDSYGYRVEDEDGVFIYTADGEYKTLDPAATQHYVEFFHDADVLVFDAMYSWRKAYLKEDWGHGSAVAGADLATRAGVRRLLLFHHDPISPDQEIWSLRDIAEDYLKQHPERPPCEVIVAYDGFEMELWREAKLETRLECLPEGIVIHLRGRLAEETVPVVLGAIDEAEARTINRPSAPVVVNLSEVTNTDQDGLKALFAARRRRCIFALSGLSHQLHHNFVRAGALGHFAIFDTPHQALVAMNQGLKLHPGQVLQDRYKIDAQLDHTPLGNCYLATDRTIDRQVTIQVLSPCLGTSPLESLVGATQAAINLRHPLIASILDVGQDDLTRYLALEYAPGHSVRQLLAPRSPQALNDDGSGDTLPCVEPAEAVRIGLQIAQALEYAHNHGVVHGGLKPENIILVEGPSIKVTRFGISRVNIDRPLSELPAHVGSLDYLAPEQLRGYGNSPASDLYALGIVLYEMLTGRPPFAATASEQDLISLQLRQAAVPPRRRNPNLSRSLEHLILSLLRKSPGERPCSASVVRKVLAGLNPHAYDSPLLGRDALQGKLQDYLKRASRGQSGLLILHGERGSGKSRLLLSAAIAGITNQPVVTLHGRLFAHEDARPYKLFLEPLRRALLDLPAHQLTQLLDDLDTLSGPLTALIPDLRPVLSAFALSGAECQRLEEAICEALRLLTAKGPALLVLDGLQWIDVASSRLLNRLARQTIPGLLIVGLYRTEEVGQNHPLRQTLEALEPWIDELVQVPPLGPIDVHQMASTLCDIQQVPPDFGLWLYGETGGNPLHVEQMIQAYLEGPDDSQLPQERTLATTLGEVVSRRLERLPGSTLGALRQAAVLGHSFHFNTLRSALDQPEKQVLTHLDCALQAQFVVGNPADDQYSFRHPLIREVLYDEMLEGVRKRLHVRAARALERGGKPGIMDEKIDLLAHHYFQAGEHEQAIAYLARATRRARELCAYDAALNYVDQALIVVEQLNRTATDAEEREQRQKQRQDLLVARAKLEASVVQMAQDSAPY